MGVYIVVGVFILFDILTGIIKALYQEGLNSTKLRKGLFHKLSEIIAVAGSGLIEYGLAYVHLNIDLPLLNIVSVYICTMELVSVLENLGKTNPSLAKLFKPYLEKIKSQESEEEKE